MARSWQQRVTDKIIELKQRNGTSIKELEKHWQKSDSKFIKAALKALVKGGIVTKIKTKYKLNVPANESKKLLTPQEVLKTAKYIEGSFAWIGDVFSNRGDNFNFMFVFATSDGCFFCHHDSDQRFAADGMGGKLQIPDDPGYSDPDSGQPFTIPGTMQKPAWLEDQLKPYRSEVESDPVAFANVILKGVQHHCSSIRLQMFGRQPLRELLGSTSNWGWGLKWGGLETAFDPVFCEMAFPTKGDKLLYHILSCPLIGFDERSMMFDVNGLLSKTLEDDECDPCLLWGVMTGEVFSESLSREEAFTRLTTFIESFQYRGR